MTLLNVVPRSHALVRTEINFLCRSLHRPTIEESFSNMRTLKSREIKKFGKGNQEKRKQARNSD